MVLRYFEMIAVKYMFPIVWYVTLTEIGTCFIKADPVHVIPANQKRVIRLKHFLVVVMASASVIELIYMIPESTEGRGWYTSFRMDSWHIILVIAE